MSGVEHLGAEALDRWTKGLEFALMRRYECVDGFPMVISQTGEEYISFEESGRSSAQVALMDIAMRIGEYCKGRPGRLYWRCRPEIARNGVMRTWSAYARLLISDKPITWPTMADYEHSIATSAEETA